MGKDDIPLVRLQQSIHDAFKAGHTPDADANPFAWLQLFHQARREAGTDREATHTVLLSLLEALAVDRNDDAELLRAYFFDEKKMRLIAKARNISEPTAYRKKDEIITQLALILQAKELQARAEWQRKLEARLDLPPAIPLIGVDHHLDRLAKVVASPEPPWVVCIDGLGGIGKTALAGALLRQPWIPGHFHNVAWVSAKQQQFSPGVGLTQVSGPAINAAALTDALLEQLDSSVSLSLPPPQKAAALFEVMKKAPYLIVIDNLETVNDYQSLLPTLLKLAAPSKVLLTSRYSLRTHPDVFTLSVEELSRDHTIQFIRQEATVKGLAAVINAPEPKLQRMYDVVGGNPLALKLVVGQIAVLSLSHVLENLKRAKGKPIDDLYTYIYWQAWRLLDAASQKTFLLMPLAHDGTVEQLLKLTQLDIDELNPALQQLAELSLVQVGGTMEERRYTIHRLTETFLLNEAIAWNTAA
ncbi:MAG: hypothetical protein HYR94_11060 [Chloroflexi bacterium]|nr:hypothetical protein [Chloroflexota bacterium]